MECGKCNRIICYNVIWMVFPEKFHYEYKLKWLLMWVRELRKSNICFPTTSCCQSHWKSGHLTTAWILFSGEITISTHFQKYLLIRTHFKS